METEASQVGANTTTEDGFGLFDMTCTSAFVALWVFFFGFLLNTSPIEKGVSGAKGLIHVGDPRLAAHPIETTGRLHQQKQQRVNTTNKNNGKTKQRPKTKCTQEEARNAKGRATISFQTWPK